MKVLTGRLVRGVLYPEAARRAAADIGGEDQPHLAATGADHGRRRVQAVEENVATDVQKRRVVPAAVKCLKDKSRGLSQCTRKCKLSVIASMA